MSKVVEVTDQSFESEVLKSDVPTEVDFWAPWCGPCRMVGPIYDKLAEEYDDFKFCKINVDTNQRVAGQYGIQSIPMQMFFVNGEKVDELLGAVPEQQIRAKVDGVKKRFPTDEKGRLEVIISSWVEHNEQHGDRFSKWMKDAVETKGRPYYKGLVEASHEMKETNKRLSQLLDEIKR